MACVGGARRRRSGSWRRSSARGSPTRSLPVRGWSSRLVRRHRLTMRWLRLQTTTTDRCARCKRVLALVARLTLTQRAAQLHLLSFAFLANIVAVRERKRQMTQCPYVRACSRFPARSLRSTDACLVQEKHVLTMVYTPTILLASEMPPSPPDRRRQLKFTSAMPRRCRRQCRRDNRQFLSNKHS
jgi:hypothetical protein